MGGRPDGVVASSRSAGAVDTRQVTGDGEDGNEDAAAADRKGRLGPRLHRVEGPLGAAEDPPAVQLRREWKGLTVADLLRPEIVDRLPGQVRSALHHLQRGDLAAADRALPGVEVPVLPGPGHRRAERRATVVWLTVLGGLVGAAVAALWF